MVEMKIQYVGGFHCELEHTPSRSSIETDAPKDNGGKGEKFSPTDLVGAALGSCILTTLALKFEPEGLQLQGAKARVTKEMSSSPRRIAKLFVEIAMPTGIPQSHRPRIEAIAHACPVHKSLHPDVELPIVFHYPD